MIHNVELPALGGRDPLGFLAALGLLRILDTAHDVRLSFSETTMTATLTGPFSTIEDIVAVLVASINDGLTADATSPPAIAGVNPRLPYKAGTGADPMRCQREIFPAFAAEIAAIDEFFATVWLPFLLTDLADDQRAWITPFMAPRGKQNMRTFFINPLNAVRNNPARLTEALTGWRRVPGFTGEYFDHRVLRSAADDPEGRTGQEAGVPGATWLATMALPMLRLTGDGRRRTATLWHRTGRKTVMLWPLWRIPLDIYAVQCLLEHPALRPVRVDSGDGEVAVSDRHWQSLGVAGVYGADRQAIPGANFDGVLAPMSVRVID